VLDRGSLLHWVKWPRNGTYGDILSIYTGFVQKNYGSNAVVVFDGYSNGPSANDHEHERRAVKMAATVQVQESHPVVCCQQALLANASNKSQFIALRGQRLSANGHTVHVHSLLQQHWI